MLANHQKLAEHAEIAYGKIDWQMPICINFSCSIWCTSQHEGQYKARTKILECESWCYDTQITSLAAEWWTLGAWPLKSGLATRYAARIPNYQSKGVMRCCCEDWDCHVQISYYSKYNYAWWHDNLNWHANICMQKKHSRLSNIIFLTSDQNGPNIKCTRTHMKQTPGSLLRVIHLLDDAIKVNWSPPTTFLRTTDKTTWYDGHRMGRLMDFVLPSETPVNKGRSHINSYI